MPTRVLQDLKTNNIRFIVLQILLVSCIKLHLQFVFIHDAVRDIEVALHFSTVLPYLDTSENIVVVMPLRFSSVLP